MRRFALSLLVLFAAAQPSNSQDTPAGDRNQPKTYKLEGTVVNSITGEPVRRALVEVASSNWPPVLTGADGKFVFENLPAQEWSLQVTKPGFFPKQDGDNNAFEIKPGESPVRLQMAPEATVTGHVENRDGEPVERALVRVMAASFGLGRIQRTQIGQALTDEDGNFRIANLNARRCWVLVEPNQVSVRTVANDVQGIKEGYPAVVYYPAARDLSSATSLQLFPGRETEARFLLPAEPIFQVSGTVAGAPPGRYPEIRVLTTSGEDLFLPKRINQQTGTFEIRMVPAGTYVLQSSMWDVEGKLLTAEVTVTVQANVTDVNMALAAPRSIPIVVHTDFASAPSPSISTNEFSAGVSAARFGGVQLRSLEPIHLGVPQLRYDPDYEVHDVVPGKYAVDVGSGGGAVYVQSARCGSVDLLREPLVVPREGELPPIELVVRDDGGTVSGTVQGAKPSGTIIVVVPEKASIQTPRMARADESGRFSITGVPPGDYQVFAFDSAAQIEYSNPAALAGFAAKAVRATVSPKGQSDVVVELIHIGE